jgi:hypothetical protein
MIDVGRLNGLFICGTNENIVLQISPVIFFTLSAREIVNFDLKYFDKYVRDFVSK